MLSISSALLLVVDVQNGFVDEDTEHILEPINELLAYWRKNEGVIVCSRFINPEGGLWERLRDWHECKDEPDILLHPALEKGKDLVKDKQTYTAWGADLSKLCAERGLDTAVLCGIDTNECVLATAIDVFEAGIKPLVVADCCASSAGDKFHQAGLLLLERLIGREQIIDSAKILRQ